MKKWLAAYLYYAEPFDTLIIEALKPFADEIMEAGLADKYFFIRYWEQGPHVRLRFLGDEQVLETQLKPKLENWFNAWMTAHPSDLELSEELRQFALEQKWFPNNSVQWIEYEPETERYGGEHALPVGETQFQASSDAVLTVMDASENWNYDQSLGTAIQMHLAFARACEMDKQEAALFYSWIFQGWLPMAISSGVPVEKRQEALQTTIGAFEQQFNEQQEVLVPFIDEFWTALWDDEVFEEEWLNDWVIAQKAVQQELDKLDEKSLLEFPDARAPQFSNFDLPDEKLRWWALYSSYVHMTNNRLGVKNRDEGYLGFLLWKGLLS